MISLIYVCVAFNFETLSERVTVTVAIHNEPYSWNVTNPNFIGR